MPTIPSAGYIAWYSDNAATLITFDTSDYLSYTDDILLDVDSGRGSLRFNHQGSSGSAKFFPRRDGLPPSISLFTLGPNGEIQVSTQATWDFLIKFFFKVDNPTGQQLQFFTGEPASGQTVGKITISNQIVCAVWDGTNDVSIEGNISIYQNTWYELEILHQANNSAFVVKLYDLTLSGNDVIGKTLSSSITYSTVPNKKGARFYFQLPSPGSAVAKLDFIRFYVGVLV